MIFFFIVPEHTILGMIVYAGKLSYMVSIYLHDCKELDIVSKITHTFFADGALMFKVISGSVESTCKRDNFRDSAMHSFII